MKKLLIMALLCIAAFSARSQARVDIIVGEPRPCRDFQVYLILQDPTDCSTITVGPVMAPGSYTPGSIPGGVPPNYTEIIGADVVTTMEVEWCLPTIVDRTIKVGAPAPPCMTPSMSTS